VPTITVPNLFEKEVPRDGIEPPTQGFSERPRARPPPFEEAPFYLYLHDTFNE